MKIELTKVNFNIKGLNIFGVIITTKKQLRNLKDFSAEKIDIIKED